MASAVGQTTPPLAYDQPVPPTAVQAVQEHLRSAGAYNGAADGMWGSGSVAALQRFQASHQLQVTRQLNQATAATLGLDPAALLGSPQAALPPPMSPAENLRTSSIRAIQSRLRGLGFYTGAVDGVWGQSTKRDRAVSAGSWIAAEWAIESGDDRSHGAFPRLADIQIGVRSGHQAGGSG